MAKKRLLTWHRPSRRWKKQIDGIVHYFGYGSSENDLKGYKEAEGRLMAFMDQRERQQTVIIPLAQATIGDICEKYLQQLEDRYSRAKVVPTEDQPTDMRRRPEVSAAHVEKVKACLQVFTHFVGERVPFAAVKELLLEDYRNHTLKLPKSRSTGKAISPHTAKTRLLVIKTLMQWAYEMGLHDLPRNLRRFTQVALPQPSPQSFTVDEIQALWKAASPRMRCFMALALNCGMGQQDIADLLVSEIDLGNGVIERDRSKTAVRSRHKLWKVTVALLTQEIDKAASSNSLAFRTIRGHRLVENGWSNGKLSRSDSISCSFRRLMKKAGLNSGRGFYTLRKTGASEIEKIDSTVTEMYLAHSEKGMKRNYAERHWEALTKALGTVEAIFNLPTDDPASSSPSAAR